MIVSLLHKLAIARTTVLPEAKGDAGCPTCGERHQHQMLEYRPAKVVTPGASPCIKVYAVFSCTACRTIFERRVSA